MKPLLVVQHHPDEDLGALREMLIAERIPVQVRRLDLEEPLPSSLRGFGGVISLGGPMSVHDEGNYPWLNLERRCLAEAIDAGLPTLGICLGAQLIAQVCGAPVHRHPNGPEIGWWPVRVRPSGRQHPAVTQLPPEFFLFHWHEDQCACPFTATPLLTSAHTDCQAFAVGEHVLAIQAHAELTPELLERWLLLMGSPPTDSGKIQTPEEISRLSATPLAALPQVRQQLFGPWLRSVRMRCDTPEASPWHTSN
ncbi:type 1 glutamine amidotransferase [Acidithiobacillus caldus]|uniref:Glutamine amidotransferase class-I n=1 Tax=Acidithiobacillus caldus (strain SM-1) TaxID=990288 RepID=F9ZPW3_ACICS|nr:type 1 glutamine amidotransferase [Acidithiobacillus caldus]AEK58506.1 glutamine amidotransferase class-I [Acidithiobacillus caldus SM-1]AUW33091.1 type 1 glutamine amidotransferase [Acidithiobacillus caldus]MBU2801828.1 type 1 glutamine amidotransferase [Acidithiobacillus caldus]QER46058.1 glutamine amidotransferase (class I) [Acidithiobacillus caldus]